MRFMVSPELAPGVARKGMGIVRVGEVFSLPDDHSGPLSVHLIPMDEKAKAALVAAQKRLPTHKDKDGKEAQHRYASFKLYDIPSQTAASQAAAAPSKRQQVASEGAPVKDLAAQKPAKPAK